jgi:hypothetical protein
MVWPNWLQSERVRRIATPVAICIAAGVVAVLWYLSEPEPLDGQVEVPVANVQDAPGSQQDLYNKAVADYVPKVKGRIDDLTVPAAEVLRQLPGVASVDQPLKPAHPTARLVQLRDWHYVTKEWFAKDMHLGAGRPPMASDFDLRYQDFLVGVEQVQMEQMATLRCLIKYHDLKRVYIERLTPEQMPAFKDKIAALREAEPHQDALRKRSKDAWVLVEQWAADGETATARHAKALALALEIAGMLEQHRLAMLEIGAAGRLLVSGELEEVLPLDDAELLDAAGPVLANGKLAFDPLKVAARQDAMVQRALAKDHAAVIVLGGSHDLTDSVRGVVGEGCEYIRVTGHAFREYAGEGKK